MAKSLQELGVTVTISSDPLCLGEAATSADVETYRENLRAHLAERFGCEVIVRTDSVLRATATDDDVACYVRELHAGDGWTELL